VDGLKIPMRPLPSGIKRECGESGDTRCRGCPRNCKRRVCRQSWPLANSEGRRQAFDPQARRSAIAAWSSCAQANRFLAIFNLVVLVSVWRTFRSVKRGEPFCENDFDILLNSRGLLARFFRPIFKIVTKSWRLFLIGDLFGLGFDTATEIALFGISATRAANGASFGALLVPALFLVGMSLIDTTDCVLMLGAYRRAFMRPTRKLYYNTTITAVSIIVALADLGHLIIGVFAGSWLVSALTARWATPIWTSGRKLHDRGRAQPATQFGGRFGRSSSATWPSIPRLRLPHLHISRSPAIPDTPW
jgi:HoxN/HupN/NixA family high-affinity nickel-transporter